MNTKSEFGSVGRRGIDETERDKLLKQRAEEYKKLEEEVSEDFPSEVKEKQKKKEASPSKYKVTTLLKEDAKTVEFSFVKRFREHFQKMYAQPEVNEVEMSLLTAQRQPEATKLYSLAHNILRFKMMEVRQAMSRQDIEEFVALLGFLYKIFYRHALTYFKAVEPDEDVKEEDTDKARVKEIMKKMKKSGQQRYGMIKFLLYHLIDAMIMCANEAERLNVVEPIQEVEVEEEVKAEDATVNTSSSVDEYIRDIFQLLFKIATVTNTLTFFIKQIGLRKNLGELPQFILLISKEPLINESLNTDYDEKEDPDSKKPKYLDVPDEIRLYEQAVRMVYQKKIEKQSYDFYDETTIQHWFDQLQELSILTVVV